MAEPVAVLISDVHFNLQTLKLADAAMRQAIAKANELHVPLVVAGDLHDTKANLRGECMNAMIETFDLLDKDLPCYILRGNHDAINEKSEEHSIGFLNREDILVDGEANLREGRTVIVRPTFTNDIAVNGMSVHLIPYQHDANAFREYLKKVDKGSCIIAHQGLQGSNMGEYFQDKSAINPEDVADYRVISGHYHTRQTIKTRPMPRCIGGSFKAIQAEHELHDKGVGTFDYIGNPYTLSYAEASDPDKGFQILYNDGSLEFIPTNLRKHRIWELNKNLDVSMDEHNEGDLVWVKIRGTHEELSKLSRGRVAEAIGLTVFKLDFYPEDSRTDAPKEKLDKGELLDSLIDSLTNTSDERKIRLKELWRHLGS